MTLKSNVRYCTRFWPKYWAASGPVGQWARSRKRRAASRRVMTRASVRSLACARDMPCGCATVRPYAFMYASTGRLSGPEHRGIAPQPLQTIEIPRLRMEQMDHHIHEIEQYPPALRQPFRVMRAVPQRLHRLGHRIRETPHMGVRGPRRDHEPVGGVG